MGAGNGPGAAAAEPRARPAGITFDATKKGTIVSSIMPLDVLLVDDHKIMRDGIKAILSRGDEFRVVGEAENGADAVQFTKRLRPHMVLMDIGLPGLERRRDHAGDPALSPRMQDRHPIDV